MANDGDDSDSYDMFTDTEDDSASEPHRFSVSVSQLPADTTTVDRKRSRSDQLPSSPGKSVVSPKQWHNHQSVAKPPGPPQQSFPQNILRMQQQQSSSMTHLYNGSANPQQAIMQQMRMKQQSASMRYMSSAPFATFPVNVPPPPSSTPPTDAPPPSHSPSSPTRKEKKSQSAKTRHHKTLPYDTNKNALNALNNPFPPPPPDPSPDSPHTNTNADTHNDDEDDSPFKAIATQTSDFDFDGLPRPPAFTYAPDSIDRVSAASSSSNTMNRAKAVNELIETERSYVNQLEKLLSLYADKLKNQEKIMNTEDHRIVFPSSLRIIKNLNSKLLADLSQRQTTCGDDTQLIISDIIVDYAPHFRMYQKYMANSSVQLERLTKCLDNSKFFQFQEKMRKKFKNLGLTDLIIVPVQRIPRYKLLLQEIVKRTESEHPDYNGLKEALALIEQVNAENNETLKDFDARMQVWSVMNEMEKSPDLVSPARRFICSGELHKIKISGKLEREMFYLFNDCLVYATPKSFGTKRLFKMRIPIDSAFSVQNLKNTQKYKNLFAIYSSLESFMLSAKHDGAAKQQWIKVLGECIENAKSGHYFHSNSSTARVGRGSVLISRAKLQIPKSIKKELNKELAVIHMPQTLDPKRGKGHQRFRTKQQIDLLALNPTKDDGMDGADELSDDEKDFFKAEGRRRFAVTPLTTSQSVKLPESPLTQSQSVRILPGVSNATSPKTRSAFNPTNPRRAVSPRFQYKSRTPTTSPRALKHSEPHTLNASHPSSTMDAAEEDEKEDSVPRQRSRSFGGSTSGKSALEYHRKPHHHVPSVVPQLESIQNAKAKLRPKSAVKFKPLPLIQSNSSDATPKQYEATASSAVEKKRTASNTSNISNVSYHSNGSVHSPKSPHHRKLPDFPLSSSSVSPPPPPPPPPSLLVASESDKTLLWRNADCKKMENRLLFDKMRQWVRDCMQFADNQEVLTAMRQKIGNGQRVMVVANAQDERMDHELVKAIRTEMKYMEQLLVFNNARGVYRAPWVSDYKMVTLTQSEHALMSHIKTFADSVKRIIESAPSSAKRTTTKVTTNSKSTNTKKRSTKKGRDAPSLLKKSATFNSLDVSGHSKSQSKGVSDALAVINRNKNKFKSFDDAETKEVSSTAKTTTTVSTTKTKLKPQSKPSKPFTGDTSIWNAYLDGHGGSEPTNEWMLHKFVKAESSLPTISFKQAREMYKACKGKGKI